MSETDPSESPTLTDAGYAKTSQGQILGTAAYMSPEQARGLRVDATTDVWAFGACLFEAVSGSPAFAGRDGIETLGAVLKSDPEWRRLPETTPAAVHRILRRTLEKDSRRRLRSIADVQADLEEALLEPGRPSGPELVGGAGAPRPDRLTTVPSSMAIETERARRLSG